MDKVLISSCNSYCRYMVFKKLLKPLRQSQYFLSTLTCQKNICLSSQPSKISSQTGEQTSKLFHCGGRNNSFCVQVCHFHGSNYYSSRRKMNKRSSNEEERILENWNWNINSDPGLGSLYDEMNKELSTIECKTEKKESQENDYGISGNLTDERIEELTKSFNQTSTTIEVEDLSLEEVDDVQPKWVPPVELKRGRQGVFDVEEIVTVLRSSNARDICVIKMPDTLQISDYMVIATGISYRHCRSMTKDIQFIHKRKRSNKDSSLKVEGLDSENWLAFDLGNIILHLFTPETRELYDLESLWTVGEKYDDKCQEIEDEFGLQQTDLDWLKQLDLELTSDRNTS
ncbi:uncharacterized protein LOC127717911 [Mytilus californianus]|uniref:uncharacterized protein LOC127717911 n=1 Tax=Mytilus californianus TaxID=6549 RepID=UPI0022477D8B|nr:uncharacterized protein LOC127717911 [Mytilus californianus]